MTDFIDLDGEQPAIATPSVPPEVIGQGADYEPRRRPLAAPQRHQLPQHTMPASEEAEQHVIACCLLEGDDGLTLKRAQDAGLTQDSFYFPANQIIFAALTELARSNKPLSLEVLAEELTSAKTFDQVGGFPYLMQVTAKVPTTAHAGYFIEKVAEAAEKRALIRNATGLIEAAYAGEDASFLRKLAETIAPGVAKTQTTLASHLDLRRVRLTTPPPEPTIRLFLAGKPIATPGNLVTVIAKSKTGKTAALGAATAAIIGAHYDRTDLDTFKFTAPHTDEAVILIDTEQSPYDAWTCHSRTMARAGNPNEPDWLHHYALVGDSAQDLRKVLPVALERGKTLHKGVFALILDGVADFVASVNDEAECNEFVTYLRKLAVDFDCPVICVIHSNEGIKTGDDGRGHLGKQLTRKAESNLLLKKVGDTTTITSEKQRKAPITEADGVAFQWSDEHGRHVSCETTPSGPASKSGPKPKYDPQAMLACVPAPGDKPMPTAQIHRRVCELPSTINIRTFKDYLAKWVETGEVERIEDRALGFVFRRRF